jgi:putative endopeptidase
MPHTRRARRDKKIPSQPDIPPPQKNISPGDDFYKFVNGKWLRHVNMPPYLSSYGVSEEIEDQVNKELMEILFDARKRVVTTADKHIPHTIYLLGTLAESALNNKVQENSVKFLRSLINNLRCIRSYEDVASSIGDFLKNRINTLIGFMAVIPENDGSTIRLTLMPGDLGLPDTSYYENRHSRIIGAYTKLLQKLSIDFDIPGLERLVTIETISAEMIIKSRGDSEILLSGKELQHKFPAIPWQIFFQSTFEISAAKLENHKILITSPTWFEYLNKLFKHMPIDQWKLLLAGNLLVYMLPLLPPPYDDMEFELFGHRMRGQSEKMPQKRLTLRLAQQWLKGSLGSVYVEKCVNPTVKEDATSIAKEIKQMAFERIGLVDWLDIKTRKKAQKKIDNIYLGVAYPSVIQKDKKTNLNPENLLENVLKLSNLDFKDETEKINTKLNLPKWDDPVFAVNAYYYNEGNKLILPAGILRWPFFNTAANDGWNFGGIGATIGHEICHAFDNDGKEFDEFGRRDSWWNETEIQNYRKKAKKLIELFNKTEYYGHHLNGMLTLSENIADLGGLAIALEALKKRLKSKNLSKDETKKQLCNFFISFAVSWRTKEKKEKVLQSLFMDVHSPPSARVNNIVAQFDDWYECFDIKPGDKLYVASENRIHIF